MTQGLDYSKGKLSKREKKKGEKQRSIKDRKRKKNSATQGEGRLSA